MGVSVRGLPELRAAALLLKQADAPTRAALKRESRAWAPTLERAIKARARTDVDRRIAASARTTVTAKGLKATVGASGRLPSGDALREVTRPYEFGGNRNVRNKYVGRSPKGKAVIYRRRTQRQIPDPAPNGRMVYQGLADVTPELVSRYVRALAKVMSR
jgi:hypothetical protein